jgi:16S rRNA (guanine527-N7)-methyltransferase
MTGEQAHLLQTSGRGLGVEFGADSIRRLDAFLGLLHLWNQRTRLVGDREAVVIVAKHVVDCLAPVALMPPRGIVVDVGSGGGFPGAIIACLRPDLGLVFIESRRRPASFLREVVRSVPLPEAQVVEQRGEDAAKEPQLARRANAVISRALRADVFLPIAAQLVASDGTVVAMQTPASIEATTAVGRSCGLELADQRRYELPSGEARVLIVFRPAAGR